MVATPLMSIEVMVLFKRFDFEGIRLMFLFVASLTVPILCPPSSEFVASLLGTWIAGGVAVPLYPRSAITELRYIVDDSEADFLLVHPSLQDTSTAILDGLNNKPSSKKPTMVLTETGHLAGGAAWDDFRFGFAGDAFSDRSERADGRALIVYTSGTTGPPKGVVHTHSSIYAATIDLNYNCQLFMPTICQRLLTMLPTGQARSLLFCPVYSIRLLLIPLKNMRTN